MRKHDRPRPITRPERFTIAHELGHFVLQQESNFRPRRRAEYWLGESLCDHFASRLLIREQMLEGLQTPRTTTDLMELVNEVARAAEVTAEPAAKALTGFIEQPIAVGTFLLDPRPSTKRLGFRAWWSENRPWWGARGGRRLAVYADHPLAPVLREIARLEPWQATATDVDGARSALIRRRWGRWAAFAALLSLP